MAISMGALAGVFRHTLLAAVLALSAPPATAQDKAAEAFFARMDLDGDGTLDSGEVEALRLKVFNRMDDDRDGVLTRAEFVDRWIETIAPDGDPRRARLAELRSERFDELDSEADGALTREEYVADGRARFKAADRDGDGRLSVDEFGAEAAR